MKIKTRVNKLLSALLVMAIMLGLFAAMPLTASAAAGDYNTGDIAIINAMIDNNNLTFPKAPTNGSSVPTYWDAYIVWSSVATNKRIIQLNLGGRFEKLTGTLNLSGLTSLQRVSLYSHNITSLNVSGLTNLTYLDCENNKLSTLNVSSLTNLETLDCKNNSLTSLNVSGLTKLKTLYAQINSLTSLALNSSAPYTYIDVRSNKMESTAAVTGRTIAWDTGSFYFSPQNIISAPTNLTAAVGATGITLTWKDNSNNEDGFMVERREGSGTWSTLHSETVFTLGSGTVGANVTTYTDTSAETGKTYSYRVRAYTGTSVLNQTFSAYSNQVTVTMPLIAAPTNLTATVGATGITLTWKDNSNNEDGFMVERREGSGSWSTLTYMVNSGTVGANITTYTDTSAVTGKTYSYRVRAYTGTVLSRTFSAYSNEVTVTYAANIVAAPTNLTATVGATGITLNWTNNATNANFIHIERKESDGAWTTPFGDYTADTTTFVDTTAQAGKTYTYRVRALSNMYGSSNNSNEVTVTMPAITTYAVTIISGTGGGNYAAGATVNINANTAPSGKIFDTWTASGVTLSSPGSANTTFIMPSNAVTVTATYKDLPAPTYTITIQNDGNGTANANSSSASAGTAITLSATPNSGYQFKEWQVVSGGVTVSSNSFTMPTSNVTIKAVFEQIPATTTPPGSSTTPSNSNSTPPIAVIVLLAVILIGATVFITMLVMKKKKN